MTFIPKVFLVLSFIVVLNACKSEAHLATHDFSDLEIGQVSKSELEWPRTIMTRQGPLTLPQQPKRIVSTSVTLTGTLLAINAPLVGSGATMANTSVADEKGFMRQWSDVAKAKNLKALYQREANAEAVLKSKPDLIIVSATGADSALKLYDQLKDIAPTLVIGYDDKSWMHLATIFGDILGLENNARKIIAEFEQQLDHTRSIIELPPQPTTAMVYYLDGTGGNIWTENSAQGQLLNELGFSLAKVPEEIKGDISMGKRNDIIIATGERFPDAVNGHSVLLFAGTGTLEQKFKSNPYLLNTLAVQEDNVFAMGNDTFRLDYFSSSNLLNRVQQKFKKPL